MCKSVAIKMTFFTESFATNVTLELFLAVYKHMAIKMADHIETLST